MTSIVTYAHRYKRPPRHKAKAAVRIARVLLPTLAAALFPVEAQEVVYGRAFQTGNQLLETCNTNAEGCTGYIAGTADAMTSAQLSGGNVGGVVACIPGALLIDQAKDVVIGYLRKHPELLNTGAANLVARALRDAFPCR